MTTEHILRLAYGLVVLASAATAGGLRWQTLRRNSETPENASPEPSAPDTEGWAMFLWLRTAGGLFSLVAGSWPLVPVWWTWADLPLPAAARWLGIVVGVLSLVGMAWTLWHLGGNAGSSVTLRREHELVTSGPYAWCRHPYYVVFAGFVGFATLATANWLPLLTGLATFWAMLWRLPLEEAVLEVRFGEQYREYRKRVGAFWPRQLQSR